MLEANAEDRAAAALPRRTPDSPRESEIGRPATR